MEVAEAAEVNEAVKSPPFRHFVRPYRLQVNDALAPLALLRFNAIYWASASLLASYEFGKTA